MNLDTKPLLDDNERADRDRLLAEVHRAIGSEFQARTEAARALREIRDRRLYRDDHETFEAFSTAEFGRSASWAYQRIELADVADALDAAEVEPLTAAYQAGLVVQLRDPDPEVQDALRVRAVELARANAARKSRRPTEADFKAACGRVLKESAAQAAEAALGTGQDDARATIREAVRAHKGLLVALRVASDDEDPDGTLARLAGLAIVPHAEGVTWPEPPARATDAVQFPKVKLDDWTDLTWPVLASDPWKAAEAWTASTGPFRATLYPDRLSSPRTRARTEASDRDRTVLVSPDVDVLDEAVPDAVVHAIVDAAAADPSRHYVVLTQNPGRVWDGWPPNVFVAAEASVTAKAVADAAQLLRAVSASRILIVRDLAETVKAADLDGVSIALVRGEKTQQQGYDSLRAALGAERIDVGRKVKVRHAAYLPLTRLASPTTRPAPSPIGLPAVPRSPSPATAA